MACGFWPAGIQNRLWKACRSFMCVCVCVYNPWGSSVQHWLGMKLLMWVQLHVLISSFCITLYFCVCVRLKQVYFSSMFTKPPSPPSLWCICHSQEAHWACQGSGGQLEGECVCVCVSLLVTSFPQQRSVSVMYTYVSDDKGAPRANGSAESSCSVLALFFSLVSRLHWFYTLEWVRSTSTDIIDMSQLICAFSDESASWSVSDGSVWQPIGRLFITTADGEMKVLLITERRPGFSCWCVKKPINLPQRALGSTLIDPHCFSSCLCGKSIQLSVAVF